MYSIAKVEELSGISAFTIRYYDKCGFFPHLQRDEHGSRSFSQDDVNQLQLIDALRKSGLSIEGIQYYVKLGKTRVNTQERLDILKDRLKVLQIKRSELDSSISCLTNTAFALQTDLMQEIQGEGNIEV